MGKQKSNGLKVLTAGGAANPGRSGNGKSSRRRNNNNNNTTTTTTNGSKNKENSTPDEDLGSRQSQAKNLDSEASSGDKSQSAELFQTEVTTETFSLEYEEFEAAVNDNEIEGTGSNAGTGAGTGTGTGTGTDPLKEIPKDSFHENELVTPVNIEDLYQEESQSSKKSDLLWLFLCFIGIMASFVCYGLILEYTTSGGRKLHELSFLFVTSGLYTLTAAAGRYVRGEEQTTIPPSRFAILGLTSMGSTFTSVRSLRFVIYPIQVLAKSCKPVPVMLMGTLMGKRYPLRKYVNVVMIVIGVAFFMGGGDNKKGKDEEEKSTSTQMVGIFLLFISLCFDGGTGAYEDKLMSVHSVQPFDLMYNIQLGKTILAGVALLVLNQLHIFIQMCQEMGMLLVALGLSGAMGQVFIFVTIAKFGALTCSIIGLSRKITTLLASIYFYGHHLNGIQVSGLVISVTAMVMNFMGKKGGGHGHGEAPNTKEHEKEDEEMQKMLAEYQDDDDDDVEEDGDIELPGKSAAR